MTDVTIFGKGNMGTAIAAVLTKGGATVDPHHQRRHHSHDHRRHRDPGRAAPGDRGDRGRTTGISWPARSWSTSPTRWTSRPSTAWSCRPTAQSRRDRRALPIARS